MSQKPQFVPSLETLDSKCIPSTLGSLPGGLPTTRGHSGQPGPGSQSAPVHRRPEGLACQVRAARLVGVPFAKRGRVVIDFGAHHLTSEDDCAAWAKWSY